MPTPITNPQEIDSPAIIAAMQRSAIDHADPELRAVRGQFEQSAVDAVLCRMMDRWLNGYPKPALGEYWPLVGMGILGGDGCALKLSALIPKWAGNRFNKRAIFALEVLRYIGTDTALMVLDATARKLKIKSIQERSAAIFDEIARQRGVSREELDDCVVPHCGLDARGVRTFDYGTRTFRFALRPNLKPAVKDDAGKLLDNLPPARQSDDSARAAAALAEWKVFKKQVQDSLKLQSSRLEQAMVTCRRWPLVDFKSLIVNHPLMTHLARLFVWASYGDNGAPTATFRIDESSAIIDRSENMFTPDPSHQVGIVHPLQLSATDLSAWGEVLVDYDVVPPFPQLGRPVFRLEPDEIDKREIVRFSHVRVHAASLVGGLNRLGWQRGLAHDGGTLRDHSKPFIAANVTAIVEYDPGVYVAAWQNGDPQRISRCYFVRGRYVPKHLAAHGERVPLGKIDNIVLSEVLMDLNSIASKGI